jgi:hypothetical protein
LGQWPENSFDNYLLDKTFYILFFSEMGIVLIAYSSYTGGYIVAVTYVIKFTPSSFFLFLLPF